MASGIRLNDISQRLRRPAVAWCALAALLALGAVLVAGLTSWAATAALAAQLDWQPASALQQPWRAFSAAWVHLDGWHLLANLAGAAAVAAFGWAAASPPRDALAWLAAWPLTHLLLWSEPSLTHYAGMSGVLHAGVAVAALSLVWRERGPRRAIGALVMAGLLLKLLGEDASTAAVQWLPGWDFPVAVLAHATGAVAGLLCAAVACATGRRQSLATMR